VIPNPRDLSRDLFDCRGLKGYRVNRGLRRGIGVKRFGEWGSAEQRRWLGSHMRWALAGKRGTGEVGTGRDDTESKRKRGSAGEEAGN
jgi:hypothetical protein